MTESGAAFQPGAQEITVPFRPRTAYAGYKAFGSGDGAVLVDPRLMHKLRTAAEFATQERRIAGGLLFGRGWVDDEGAYLVVDRYLEDGPGENYGDRLSADGEDQFTLSDADLRLLREDAARMYTAFLEVGWWRSLATLGEFGPGDFVTQAKLVGPDGVGLLVYGSGLHWGTAYLGPEGRTPDTAGTLVAVDDAPPVPRAPAPDLAVPVAAEPEVIDLAAGESLLVQPPAQVVPPAEIVPPADIAEEPPADTAPLTEVVPDRPATGRSRPGATPAAGRSRPAAWGATRQRVTSRVRIPPRARGRAARPAESGYPEPGLPLDVQIVVGALAIVAVAAAIIIGALVHSVIVAVIIAVVGLLAIFSTVWMSRRLSEGKAD
jgi:hypothetical protein